MNDPERNTLHGEGEEENEEEQTIDYPLEKEEYKCYHVNTSILPSKIAFFCETGRRIGYAPNIALFLTSIGMNKAEAGFVVGFR